MRLLAAKAIRDLTKVLQGVKDFPHTKAGKASSRALNKQKPFIQTEFKTFLIDELHKLGRGFSSGTSRVEKNLKVAGGPGLGRGISGFKAYFTDEKAGAIATIWNTGGTIKSKRSGGYLAEPRSGSAVRLQISPRKYPTAKTDPYESVVYKNVGTPTQDPDIEQDVYGLMVIKRRRANLVRRKGVKKPPLKTVATFLLLRKQVHRPTLWAVKALQRVRKETLPTIVAQLAKDVTRERVVS